MPSYMTTSSTHNHDLLTTIESFDQARILVIGDVMLDKFIYGSASRISPEAPIPVLAITNERLMLGGAGNVIRNLASLGASATFIALMGDDETAQHIDALTREEANITPAFVTETGRSSTIKTRYIADTQQLLRADHEDCSQLSQASELAILQQCEETLEQHHILVLSDYAKGMLSPTLTRQLIALAHQHQCPVFIDPKQWDISLYAEASLLCPNEKEAQLLHHAPFKDDDEMIAIIAGWCSNHNIGHILVTRGAKGMMLMNKDGLLCHIKAQNREVYDVSGAGDTVLATLAASCAIGATMEDAALLANHAAGIAVGRMGTATVHRTDLKTAIYTSDITTGRNKILSQEAARGVIEDWQQRGLKVGFTNGCFDIVHTGHITSLSQCKKHCDRLVLAVNSDASVKRLKGKSRPVNNEMDRAMLLAALSDIDAVVIFREDTPEAILEALRPDVLMKGEDYQKHEIVGWQLVESYGGEVVRIPLVDGYSTTNTIAKINAS